MRKIHSLGLVGAVALVLAAVVAPAANGAVTRVETDQFSGVASAQALDLSLLGRRLTFGIASVRRLPGNVGYVDTTMLYPLDFAAPAVSAAMTLVAPTDALLLDVRRNRGGTPDTSAFLQSYLVDERTHYLDIYEREGDLVTQMWTLPYVPGPKFGGTKPIWVLTGPATFSGGEDLAFSLQRQGRAKTVGEPTRGGAHPREQYKVDTYLDVTVSIARSYDPKSGENWEGVGVPPNIPVAADKAFDTAYALALRHVLELGDAGPRRIVADEARKALDQL